MQTACKLQSVKSAFEDLVAAAIHFAILGVQPSSVISVTSVAN
jgi:hypothetical protein